MISHLYPTSTPELNLNFKSSRVVDPRISCTRSTTATYVDPVSKLVKTAGANEVRVEKGGLVVEESRTNILTQSNNFTTWNLYNVTINSNVETAPDGTTTASKMQWSSSSNRNMVFLQPTANVTQTHTCSFYAKADEWNYAVVAMQPPGGGQPRYYITVDLTTGDVEEYTQNSPTQTNYDVTQLPNGWWRVSATANVNAAGKTQVQMEVGMSPNNTFGYSVSGTPDGTSGIYIWGAQHEQGTFLTSYIPTSGSTVTRNADELSFLNNNLNSWYNNNQGAFLIDINALGFNGDYARLMQTNQNHRFEYSQFSSSSAKAIHFNWLNGGTSRTPLGTAPLGKFNIAANYSIGNVSSICIDGAETLRSSGNTAGTAAHTAPTELRLCRQSGNSQYLSSYVKRLVFYQAPIANTALEALTQ